MKVKTAEQYKALQERRRTKKLTRERDQLQWARNYLHSVGVGPDGWQHGFRSKPNHVARAIDIKSIFPKLSV